LADHFELIAKHDETPWSSSLLGPHLLHWSYCSFASLRLDLVLPQVYLFSFCLLQSWLSIGFSTHRFCLREHPLLRPLDLILHKDELIGFLCLLSQAKLGVTGPGASVPYAFSFR